MVMKASSKIFNKLRLTFQSVPTQNYQTASENYYYFCDAFMVLFFLY